MAGTVASRLYELELERWVDREYRLSLHGKWHGQLWRWEGGRRKGFRNCAFNNFNLI